MVAALQELVDDPMFEKSQLGLYVYDLTSKKTVFMHGYKQRLRPASTMKVLTAVAALDVLGGNYEYVTTLYYDGKVENGNLDGNLYVRGGFDPLFDNDNVQEFVNAVVEQDIRTVSGCLCLDLTFKDGKTAGWGWCWDDENPSLTPLQVNRRDEFSVVLRRELASAGVTVSGGDCCGVVPESARRLCKVTHTIDQALLPMMKKSDNLVAESLFYQIAASTGKAGAGRKEAAKVMQHLLTDKLHLSSEDYQIADGSGLSLYNYLSPECLVAVLCYAYEKESLFRHLFPTLPVAGYDGTLAKRMRATSAENQVQAKTGTVEGVSSLAGYATSAEGHRLAFAIMNQGQARNAQARNFQDRVCQALTCAY